MATKTTYSASLKTWQFYVLSTFSVVLGGLIYVLLRPVKAVFFNLLNISEIEKLIDSLRQITVPASDFFPNWFVYTFPNGLWAFGYTILIIILWKGSVSAFKYFWYLTIPLLVFGFEFLQLTGAIQGTFAYDDVLSGFIGIAAGVLFTKLYSHEKNKV